MGRRPYVSFEGNDYSVLPAAIGRRVAIIASLRTVRVLSGGELVAEHPRSWALASTVTDPAHEYPAVFQYGSQRQENSSARD